MSDDMIQLAYKSTQELQEQLKTIRAQIRECSDEERRIMRALAELATTFRRGERVRSAWATGEWVITDIRLGWDNKPMYFGKKIKKDGTPGTREVEIFAPYRNPTKSVEASNE